MRRRQFIALIGAASTCPLATRAQQPEPMRRIGMLTGITGEDALSEERTTAFLQELQQIGKAAAPV